MSKSLAPAHSQHARLIATTPATELRVAHLCDVRIPIAGKPQDFATPAGMREIMIGGSGVVTGHLSGEVLPGAIGNALWGPDGVAHGEALMVVRTDDDASILVKGTGEIPPLADEVRERILAGEETYWDEIHGWSVYYFETGAPKYAWLNSVVAAAQSEFTPTEINFRMYQLL